MSSGFKKSLIALSVSGLLASPAAFATNGYFAHGYSTKEKGLAFIKPPINERHKGSR